MITCYLYLQTAQLLVNMLSKKIVINQKLSRMPFESLTSCQKLARAWHPKCISCDLLSFRDLWLLSKSPLLWRTTNPDQATSTVNMARCWLCNKSGLLVCFNLIYSDYSVHTFFSLTWLLMQVKVMFSQVMPTFSLSLVITYGHLSWPLRDF